MLRRGDTQGVFQLESEGMTKLVMDLAPEKFSDLIPLVALYRPGPLGTGMVEDFIAGKHGTRTADILHPLLEPVLKDTFGVILYQEQVMQITSVLAPYWQALRLARPIFCAAPWAKRKPKSWIP